MQPLLWIDCETTGLDPEGNALLEVAAVITDERPEVFPRVFQGVLVRDNVDDLCWNKFAREMHEKNGLIDELQLPAMVEERETFMPGSLTPIKLDYGRYGSVNELEEALEDWCYSTIQALCHYRHLAIPTRGLPLAGSNPGFDRDWLEEWMPGFSKLIHYRSFDMNTLYYFFGTKKEKDARPHRALDDLFADIDKLQLFFGDQMILEGQAKLAAARNPG